MKFKWLVYLFLVAGLPGSALWLSQGCSQKIPTLASMAVRPSPTVCGFQSVYTFTNGPGCWQVDTGTYGSTSSVGVLTLSTSNAVIQNYPESLQVAVTNTGASRDAEFVINFSPTVNMDGKEMIMNLYVNPTFNPTGGGTTTINNLAVQPFAQTG